MAAGAAVTVLEARDRIGGRIWTSRHWPDLPMDLGASWIHGTEGNPLTKLAEAASAARLETSYDAVMALDATGQEVELSADHALAEDLIDKARSRAETRAADQSLAEAIRATTRWKAADDARRARLSRILNGMIAAEYGGDTDEVSAWCFDESEEFDGEDAPFPGGHDQIIQLLASGLTIRTGAIVTQVAQDGAGIRVALADGETLSADRVVVTVPLGALKSVFGIDFPAPIDAQITRWSQDPFTHGACSFNATGTTPETREALAGTDWDGRIVFVGEAASRDCWGTAHGAVFSGREAAETLADQD